MRRASAVLPLLMLLVLGVPSVLAATQLSVPSIPNFRLPSGGAVETTFPAASGGRSPYAYSVSGLPPGISFTPSTRRARGTLPTVWVDTVYTIAYFVTDGAGASASVTFTATVAAAAAPPLSVPSIPDFRLPSGGAVETTFPAASGGRSPYAYSVSGLPPGISFTPSTRRARGTLPTVWVDTVYTIAYFVTDGAGASASVTFTATVAAAAAPPDPDPDPPPPPPPSDPPPPPPPPSERTLVSATETGSGGRTYSFTLESRTEVSVSLTGMNRDIDCRVNVSFCTNRGGTSDDGWNGTLNAGTHSVRVYPYGGGSGDWTLSVVGTPTSPPPPPPTSTPPPPASDGQIVKTGVNVSNSRTYVLSLSASAEISVDLTGMTTDFDCTVSGNSCTNYGGTTDDSWSGTLDEGDHTIVVYPRGGSGNYTLTVSAQVPSTGGSTGTRTEVTTLVDASETNVSTSRTYSFTLARAAQVDVALTGLTIDFDCRIGSSRCTNRWGRADDSWSGDLEAGDYSVVVYPWDPGPGNYSLTVTVTETLTFVATPTGSTSVMLCEKDEDGNAVEGTCVVIDITTTTGEDPGPPPGTGPGDGDPGPGPGPDPGDGGGGPTTPSLDADNNNVVDHWNVVVTEDECSLNFDLNDRLGTDYDGPNTVRRNHGGVDIQANAGDPVLAWRGGSVSLVDNTRCGHGVDITHDNGWVTRYCHFREASTVSGTIRAGALVGLAGESGRASGVHAHISVITGPESRVEYFDHVDAGGQPTDDQKNRDGC